METTSLLNKPTNRTQTKWILASLSVVTLICGLLTLVHSPSTKSSHQQLATFPAYPPNPHPYSPSSKVWMYWGSGVGKRDGQAGQAVRSIMHMGRLEGGEWRSPHFFYQLDGRKIGDLIVTCCNVLITPPFENGWPVWNAEKTRAQGLRDFVANGNNLVVTGGVADLEFINHYFFYHLEPVAGNFDNGPFRMYPAGSLPRNFRKLHGVIHQNGHAVTSVNIRSLPAGTTLLYGSPVGSPVFIIKFCQRINPRKGEPTLKIRPDECKKGDKTCSCGTITYIGFTFNDFTTIREKVRWGAVLRAAAEFYTGKNEVKRVVGKK